MNTKGIRCKKREKGWFIGGWFRTDESSSQWKKVRLKVFHYSWCNSFLTPLLFLTAVHLMLGSSPYPLHLKCRKFAS